MYELRVIAGVMPWLKNRATHYHAKLEQTDKGSVIKKLFFCNSFPVDQKSMQALKVQRQKH